MSEYASCSISIHLPLTLSALNSVSHLHLSARLSLLLTLSPTADSHKVYATVVDKADHLYRLQGGEYDDEEFEAFPDRYGSIFADKVSVIK